MPHSMPMPLPSMRAPPSIRAQVAEARAQLLALGLERSACATLERIAALGVPDASLRAALALAVWHLQAGRFQAAALRAARGLEDRAALAGGVPMGAPPAGSGPAEAFPTGPLARKLALVRLLGLQRGGDRLAADAWFARLVLRGLLSRETVLARTGGVDLPARLGWINRALALDAIAPLALMAPDGRPAYDRLTADAPGLLRPALHAGGETPLVSVLIAAHDAQATLPTALRGLCAQSWRNLEILVIDDASTDATADMAARAAARDPRIRLIALPRNLGAYGARNAGLAQARGTFVTLHDADDWSLPGKIAAQAGHLLDHPDLMACTSEQARLTHELTATRLTGTDGIVNLNVSSFMLRRAPFIQSLGGWDEVRFGADIELVDRVRARWGRGAVVKLPTGPLSFLRDRAGSETARGAAGYSGTFNGVRKHYRALYAGHHARAATAPAGLRYTPGTRPFAVPGALLFAAGHRSRTLRTAFAIAADWRVPVADALEAVAAAIARTGGGDRQGKGRGQENGRGSDKGRATDKRRGSMPVLVDLPRADAEADAMAPPAPPILAALLDGRVVMAMPQDTVICDLLAIHGADDVAQLHRTLPRLTAAAIRIADPDPDRRARIARDIAALGWGRDPARSGDGV